MNKQEAIKKIEKLEGLNIKDKDFNFDIEMIPKGDVLEIIEQIDEPEKPIVPQFVADWFEDREHNLELYVSNLCVNFQLHKEQLNDEFADWYSNFENEPIQTLVKMKLYGYEVEKEKLYTVEIPNPNGFVNVVLCKDCNGKLFVGMFSGGVLWEKFGKCKLTETEIKQDFEWAWQFAKEVEE
ncbi:DUF1642 domain-containing protein [Streptococcus lutetiensis]|uniref:DUF1642 domain-containing protein n=1 Tax=Streptococcus lutetiensis TaxID=150055 RepID=UPI001BDABF19|nr:DUF1642 domain-containing protein [Streptococcus lutetiensis]MBT0938934.1 DUF1642 domain-containing protein [Streptococcus lutetiensis]MBT0945579.1 DUF1642 domain-containing protein [Streptococcus lutetiensis]